MNADPGVQRGKLWQLYTNGRTARGTSGNDGLERESHNELPVESFAAGFSLALSERFNKFSMENELPVTAGGDVVVPSDAILTLQQGVWCSSLVMNSGRMFDYYSCQPPLNNNRSLLKVSAIISTLKLFRFTKILNKESHFS